VVALGSIFTLARFSEAFLVLRAQQMDIPLFAIPLVMVAMNLVYSLTAYPFGKLSDGMSHSKMLQAGLLVLIAADIVLALSSHWSTLLFGVALWGIHMGMTQGLLAAMIAHTAPAELRGTAFGMFNLMSGIALLLASVGAGVLWETLGAASTFYAGAIICVITLLGMRFSPTPYRQCITVNSGQQWDAPNGWAPLQWVATAGLQNYNHKKLAMDVTWRFLSNVQHTYDREKKLVEKYDVSTTGTGGGGGEYPLQDGFGWTNGVTLMMLDLVCPKENPCDSLPATQPVTDAATTQQPAAQKVAQ
jgi:MFS family permease